MIKKHPKRDDDTDDFEEDWTLIDDDDEVEIPQSLGVGQATAGSSTDAPGIGGGSLAYASMVLKGGGVSKDHT